MKDGRITAVGLLGKATATRTIDATGRIVTPGSSTCTRMPTAGSPTLRHAPNVVAQGITLVAVNQDGRSRRPIRDQRALYEKQGIGPHAVLLVGHGTVRTRAMGQRDDQIATGDEIRAMQKLVEAEMNEGAFGLSSGLEYNPGRYCRPAPALRCVCIAARSPGCAGRGRISDASRGYSGQQPRHPELPPRRDPQLRTPSGET